MTKDWRDIPLAKWNTNTFLRYFADMNRERFGIEEYLPFRNWSTERGIIKRALDTHGPELLRQAFDVCFREYRPTREYPILTAGFAINYRINTVIPRLKAEEILRERVISEDAHITKEADAVKAWL